MKKTKTNILTQYQQAIIDKLEDGYTIVETFYSGKLSYEIARVTERVCAYGMPRRVKKESIWALMRYGLIEEIKLWGQDCIPKFYRLKKIFTGD